MRLAIPILIVVLLALPLQGDITSLVKTPVAAGGCSAFAETTWDNLTGWTQDSAANFSVDATNDELDIGGGSAGNWIQNDTDTTGVNHCAMWQYKTIGSNTSLEQVMLRGPNGTGNTYTIGYDLSGGNVFWSVYAKTAGGVSWQADNASGGSVSAPNDGDYISACVTGTGNDTVVTYWDHGASDPGDCRADWGTADVTYTDNPGTAVDTGTRVGILFDQWSGSRSAGVLDEFVGSDY